MTAGPAGNAMWLRRAVLFVAVFAALAGVFARFERLDYKIFWPDETYSMLRITGHTEEDISARIDRRVHSVEDLRTLDRLDPKLGYSATMRSMREEPQRGPLFYLGARAWATAFGDGVARMREFTAIFGAAGIVLAYLLGRRLTKSVLGGAVSASLVAVSPILLHLSRQVREYVCLADATLAAALLLLACLERPTAWRWAAYAAGSVAGFFISPIFVSVWAAHAITVLSSRRPKRTVVGWSIAIVCSAAVCVPWSLGSLRNAAAHARDLAWLANPYAPRALAVKWVFNVGAVFFDSEIVHRVFVLALIPAFVIVAFAAVMAVRQFRDVRFALVVSTVVCGFAPSIAIDIVKHTHYEAVTRYQMVAWVGLEMLVALAIATALESLDLRSSTVAAAAFFYLTAAGLFSYVFDRPYEVWWDNNGHLDDRALGAAVASRVPRAIVLSSNAPTLFTLARYLPDDTKIVLFHFEDPPPNAPTRAFLFEPVPVVLDAYRQRLGSSGAIVNVTPAASLAIPELDSERDGRTTEADTAARPLWQILGRS